jgi:hypothetical protein
MKMQMKCKACQVHASATRQVQCKYASHPAAAAVKQHDKYNANTPHTLLLLLLLNVPVHGTVRAITP